MQPSLPKPPFDISHIQLFDRSGPWKTKSNGTLQVLFNLPYSLLQSDFFNYIPVELASAQQDIRGLRSYRVTNLKQGAIGANEWHRIRHEIVYVAQGKLRWSCEDVYGAKSEVLLDETNILWIPSYVLHTYEIIDDDTEICVIANTLFDPTDPTTHDTYSADAFSSIKTHYTATSK